MLNRLRSDRLNFLWLCIGFILLTAIFQRNLFSFADQKFFSNFQKDSESLVISEIVADEHHIDKQGANLGFVAEGDEFRAPDDIMDSYDLFKEGGGSAKIVFSPYWSQFGGQGLVYSKLNEILNTKNVEYLQIFSSSLLALTILILFVLYRKIYDHRLAGIFLIALASSPWLIAFGRNLYWVAFLWFLPAVMAALMYLGKRPAGRFLSWLGIVLAVFLKSLSGYEYLSSITILACSVFLVAPYFSKTEEAAHPDFKNAALVFGACVLGFIAALLIHAGVRGDTVAHGLVEIFEKDIKRRTYADPALFPPIYKESLEASFLKVIAMYIGKWITGSNALVLWVPGKIFPALLILSAVGIYLKMRFRHKTFKRDLVLLIVTCLAPLSWFVLSKSHSYIHTQLNFVLWYFGFIPALLYTSMNSIVMLNSRWSGSPLHFKVEEY